MKGEKRQKKYWEMTSAELRDATREFDAGDGGRAMKPPSDALAQQRRARHKKRGRPRIGKGAKRVSVSIEGDRLKHIDRRARELGLTRSEFIADAVQRQLAKAG